MKRHPIRMLAAATLAAALLAPASASARPPGWTPPPPSTGDGSSEVQEGIVGENPGPQFGVVQLDRGSLNSITTLHRSSMPIVELPADEPAADGPPPKQVEDEQSIEEAIRERNRMFGDAQGDEAARRALMDRIMRGMP